MALPQDWTGLKSSTGGASIAGASPNERILLRAYVEGTHGQRSRYQYKVHCTGGDLTPPQPPTNVVPVGFGGQIGVIFDPPRDADYDRTLIYVATDSSDAGRQLATADFASTDRRISRWPLD